MPDLPWYTKQGDEFWQGATGGVWKKAPENIKLEESQTDKWYEQVPWETVKDVTGQVGDVYLQKKKLEMQQELLEAKRKAAEQAAKNKTAIDPVVPPSVPGANTYVGMSMGTIALIAIGGVAILGIAFAFANKKRGMK